MNLADRIIKRIESYSDYKSSIKVIRNNSYGPIYLVGGKVYRTIIEELTGRDVKAASVDWDALCMGDVKPSNVPSGWQRNPYNREAKPNSLGLVESVHVRAYHAKHIYAQRRIGSTRNAAHKIDIIGIKDIPGQTLNAYFDIVPLDIQRIALCLEKRTLYGVKGMKAINSGTIRINSNKGTMPGLDISSYIQRKAESLGFSYEGQEAPRIPCDCFSHPRAMLFGGCKFPQFHT